MLNHSGWTSLSDACAHADLLRLLVSWRVRARAEQTAPKGDWTTWLFLGGRGAGKTRAGAEWVHERVQAGAERIALVAETYRDGREVMVEGPSGLLHTGAMFKPPTFEPSRRRVVWSGGAQAQLFSAEDADGLRGYQFDTAWSDELAKWPGGEATWSNLQMGLRLGTDPRQMVTTTPRPIALLKAIMARQTTTITRASTYANRPNLADAFLAEIAAIYEGTPLGRQELLGELIEDREGALWTWSLIEAARAPRPEGFSRIVVAVDPPVTSHAGSDACGIVVAGLHCDDQLTAYVLEDATVQGLTPLGWAKKVAAAYHRWEADRVVVEVNQGGDLVTDVLRSADPTVPTRAVRATRGKILRAEPIAALYEQGRVKHITPFPELEDQMTSFTGAHGGDSPDRLDALVWALTDLMLAGEAPPSVRPL
ncbi:MAG: terminase family protein [Pseudomonadota bacterium]